jgi:hypothetical protein
MLSVTVTGSNPSGRVTFYSGVTVLGTKALSSGTASISTLILPSGTDKLTAYYSGDSLNLPGVSNVVTQTVLPRTGNTLALASQLPVQAGPRKVVLWDFNGDGKLDMAAAGAPGQTAPGGVSILLGNGDGTFQPAVTYLSGAGTRDVAVGDFNGDGNADLVVAALGDGFHTPEGVNILLGNGDGTFQPPVSIPMPGGPFSVAVGDFNGDGKADIVATAENGPSEGVNVLLGNGDGTFQTAVYYPTGWGPECVVIADFNSDGIPDLAVVNASSDNISVLLGNGDGTFQPANSFATLPSGGSPFWAASGDFNADGKPDLAVVVGNSVEIFLGNGDGTFAASGAYGAGTNPASVTVADINGDGNQDLTVVSEYGNVTALLGTGNGTFQPGQTLAVGSFLSSVAVGDFNSDGTADLVVADGFFNNVAVFLGISSLVAAEDTPQSATVNTAFGTALQAQVTNSYGNPVSNVVVNFTAPPSGAGAVLSSASAVTNAFGIASVTAMANGTSGSYTVVASAGTLSASFSLTNKPAALTVTPATEGTLISTAFPMPIQVTVRNSEGGLISGSTVNFSVPATGASAMLSSATAVTNVSGVASITATANAVPGNYTLEISVPSQGLSGSVYLTNQYSPGMTLTSSLGPSMFGASVNLTFAITPASATGLVTFYDGVNVLGMRHLSSGVATLSTVLLPAGIRKLRAFYAGDGVNLPGTSNIVTQTVNAIAGSSFLAMSPATVGHQPISLTVADLNRDGKADLVVVNSLDGNVGVLLGKGDGTFQPQVTYPVPGWWVGVADFNGDGIPDLVVTADATLSNVNNFAILLGNGDGTFQPAVVSGPTEDGEQQVLTVGDFNGDGKADIAIASCCDGNFVSILLGNGDGTFQPPANSLTGQAPESMATGDFNSDGKTDLAVGNWLDQTVSILLGNGDGTFQPKVDYPLGTGTSRSNGPTTVIVGDFNGDGRQDVAVGSLTGTVSILLGNGDGTFQAASTYPSGATELNEIASGDFNGDGRQDLAVVDYSGAVTVLYGNGDGTFQAPQSVTAGCNGQSLAVGEFNGDGRADLAVTSTCGSLPLSTPNNLTIFLGASPGVSVLMTHAANFVLEETNATYTVTVSNGPSSAATNGVVKVTENAPTGLTLVSMAGTGWTCPDNTGYCWRSDSLAVDSSYPPITVTVNVASNAPSSVTNQVTVSWSGSANTAYDVTTIVDSACDVNGGGTTNVADVQRLIDEALGTLPAVNDLNRDLVVNVADVQVLIDAVFGGSCAVQ